TIKDQNEGVIPSVTVTVTNLATGVNRTITTDEKGNYRVEFLMPGDYQIIAEKSGFKKAELNQVRVTVSEIIRADLNLEVGNVNEQVTVDTNSASAINTENPTLGAVIDEKIIDNMPLNGREFIELAGLVPGVMTGSGKTGAVESKGVSV